MRIRLSDAGKRFNREWIFRHANLDFDPAHAYAITGPNGSGKSTLLQSLGGLFQLSEGSIHFEKSGQPVKDEEAYRHLSLCAPYLDVIEEMTMVEFFAFHRQFKPFLEGFTVKQIMAAIGLEAAAGKQIRYFSSGMKQRVKLAQALLFQTEVVLLDEPCSNLDAAGIALYHRLIADHGAGRLVIVCSNDEVEYGFCDVRLSITDYKQPLPA
jgi:ABC-type multidrug transport system ATPase subunit